MKKFILHEEVDNNMKEFKDINGNSLKDGDKVKSLNLRTREGEPRECTFRIINHGNRARIFTEEGTFTGCTDSSSSRYGVEKI